jgi:hypothetical protein
MKKEPIRAWIIQLEPVRHMNLNDLTIGEAKRLAAKIAAPETWCGKHPMLGRRCLIRTYSAAGVHIGDVVYINGMEVRRNE